MPTPRKKTAPTKSKKVRAGAKTAAKNAKRSGPVFEARFAPEMFDGLSQTKRNRVEKAMNESLRKAIENHLPQLHADLVPYAGNLGISNVRLIETNKKA